MAADTKLPKAWHTLLTNSVNKTELFQYLAESIRGLNCDGTTVFCSSGQNVVANLHRQDMSGLAPCNHEEADTRVFVHVADACHSQRHSKFMSRTGDTDVVALAVSAISPGIFVAAKFEEIVNSCTNPFSEGYSRVVSVHFKQVNCSDQDRNVLALGMTRAPSEWCTHHSARSLQLSRHALHPTLEACWSHLLGNGPRRWLHPLEVTEAP